MTAAVTRPRRRNIQRLRHTQGCLTDCIAYVLNRHSEKVPYFVYPRAGWMQRVKRFFAAHGYRASWVPCQRVPRRGVHIVCGPSLTWKTAAHVVVYRAGRLVYDPEYPSRWNTSRITHRLLLEAIHGS